MKKIFFAAVLFCTALCLTGCESAYYLTSTQSLNINQNQTQIVLSNNNFRVVKNVQTYMIYPKNLSLTSETLRQSAYVELLKAAKLEGSQVLTNVVVEKITVDSGVFLLKKDVGIMVSGTVIEFTK